MILELNFEKTWRGGERQTLYNMQGFRNSGHEVELLCRKGFPLERKAKEANFKIHSFKNVIGVIIFLLLHGKKYSCFHAQTSHILTYCILTKPFHKALVIFSRRVDFVPKGLFTKLKYKLTDHIIVISEAIKKIFENFGVKNIELISEIALKKELDKKRALEILATHRIPSDKKIIGTMAAFVPHKDPLNMVEAIKLLSEQRTDFIFLHFGNGIMLPLVEEKIKTNHLDKYYKVMGFHENVEDFFSVLDVFVMSSVEEGLGSSVLDAFLYEVPVVSTNAGGLIDLVKDGRGKLCEKQSPDQLAACINTTLSDKNSAKKMAETAKIYAEKYHSMDYITQHYLSLIKKI